MKQAPPHSGLNGTRLVRVLSDLAVSDTPFAHKNFTERLGRLIDFADSMRLSALHEELRMRPFEPGRNTREGLKGEVLRVRMSLVRTLVESFVPNAGPERLKLPTLKAGMALDQLATFEPYHRFYAAHQREFESKIQSLQLRVRDGVSGMTAELAQLAALDETVRDILSIPARKYLAVIPQLLGKRFDMLLQEHRSVGDGPVKAADDRPPDDEALKEWTRPNGWLDRFFKEMQGLLLAELDLRLLPVLGLLEAIDEEVGKK